jgi:WD40 repeat protein
LASGDLHGELRVWDVAAGASVLEARHQGFVRALAFSRDGAWLASGGDDKQVRLTRIATKEARVFSGPEQSILDLAFSPDGALLAVASADSAVRVYELESGAYRVLRGHRAGVGRVAFSAAGDVLLSIDQQGPSPGGSVAAFRWRADEILPLPKDRAGLAGWVHAATSARIDEAHQPTTPP